jgi:hypothetical protein
LFKVTIADLNSNTIIIVSIPPYRLTLWCISPKWRNTTGNVETSGQTWLNNIYVWFEDITVTPFCTKEKSFTITIIPNTA